MDNLWQRYAENPVTQQHLADRHAQAGGDHTGCYQRVCRWCGKIFFAGMPHANVCSQRCRQTITLQRRHARQRLARSRQCPRCGGTFVAARKDTIYCSNACRQAAYRCRVTQGRHREKTGYKNRNGSSLAEAAPEGRGKEPRWYTELVQVSAILP